jgi:hypothetical protein
MKPEEKKETAKTRPPISLILVAVLFSVTSILELWGFYLTNFKVLTLPALAVTGLLAAVGLLRLKPWGLWLAYALYLPQMIQASVLLWSLMLLEGFPAGSYGWLLQIGLGAYLILLTLSLLLLWRSRQLFQQ